MTATLGDRTDVPQAAGVTSRASAWLAIGAAIVALVLAPPRGGDLFPPGVLGTVSAGQLEQLVGSTWRLASVGDLVPVGAQVRTVDGRATVRTRDGSVSLAEGTRGTLDIDTIDLTAGAVLVESGAAIAVDTPAVSARGRGAWRVDVDSSPRVGAYDGGVTVRDLRGGEATLGALQQVEVVDRAVSGDVGALRYLAADPWDARLMAGALAVDRQVSQLESSLERSYGTELQATAFYSDFVAVDDVLASALPGLARLRDGDRFGPPAETLVAVVVTALLTDRAGLTSRAATDEIRALRRSGATWGLVLASHDLGPDSFREAADGALRRRQAAVAEGTAAPVIVADGGGATDDTPPDAATPPDDPDAQPPGDTDPPSQPPGPEGPDTLDELGDTVDESADDVADLLAPIPGASEAVDELGDSVDDVGDDLGDDLGGAVDGTLP